MSEWQPINTAPRTGARIMLYDASNEDGDMWIGHFLLYPYVARGSEGWRHPHGWCAIDVPSHWMPLPPPPVSP